MNKIKDFLKFSWKFQLGLSLMALPAGYIALRHVNWKSKPDSRKRMIISHLVFWPVAVLGLRGMHFSFGRFAKPNNIKKGKLFTSVLACAGVIMGGFEGGLQLAKKLVPKKPYSPAPTVPEATPQAARLAYQQGMAAGYQLAARQLSATQSPFRTVTPYSGYVNPNFVRPSFTGAIRLSR